MTAEPMILLVVGLVVLGSFALAVWVSPYWLWLTGIMGGDRVQATCTEMCPVVMALKRMGLPSRARFA
jgi:hypothetical protein